MCDGWAPSQAVKLPLGCYRHLYKITSKARCLSRCVVALLSCDLLCGVEDDRPLSVLD
jgi:hypothetical protein